MPKNPPMRLLDHGAARPNARLVDLLEPLLSWTLSGNSSDMEQTVGYIRWTPPIRYKNCPMRCVS